MKSVTAAALCALVCSTLACTKIVKVPDPQPGGGGGNGGNGGMGGQGGIGGAGGGIQDAHIQVLWQFNLPRTAVNLAGDYAELHHELVDQLVTAHVQVAQDGVAALYGPVGLIWGQSGRVHPNVDLLPTLLAAADSGQFTGPAPGSAAEQANLAQLGTLLPTLTVPPQIVDGQSVPLYGPALDAFLVVTVHSTRRLCGLLDDACRIAGQAPVDYFAATRPDGSASWLAVAGRGPGVPIGKLIFLDIITSENESPDAFRTRCAAVPGFSRTLLDDLEPSPVVYYTDFQSQIGGRGPVATAPLDLCDAFGDAGRMLMQTAAHAIASRIR
ncbi:MAG TPA: hypothetical protein VKN99_25105 [Polyangia bacterium]|nr:hypothetical protein [Polyangia bacterium]